MSSDAWKECRNIDGQGGRLIQAEVELCEDPWKGRAGSALQQRKTPRWQELRKEMGE